MQEDASEKRNIKREIAKLLSLVLHLNLSFFSLLALVPQITKALSRLLDTFSCSSFSGSKSSKQVISWLSRCLRASLLHVDCVASLEMLSEWSRPKRPNISSMVDLTDNVGSQSRLLESLSAEMVSHRQRFGLLL